MENKKIDRAKEFLGKLNPITEEELIMKKIRMILIKQYLDETKSQLKLREWSYFIF